MNKHIVEVKRLLSQFNVDMVTIGHIELEMQEMEKELTNSNVCKVNPDEIIITFNNTGDKYSIKFGEMAHELSQNEILQIIDIGISRYQGTQINRINSK